MKYQSNGNGNIEITSLDNKKYVSGLNQRESGAILLIIVELTKS